MAELNAWPFFGLIPMVLRHNLAKYPAKGIKRKHKSTVVNIVYKYTFSESAEEEANCEKKCIAAFIPRFNN